MRDYVTLSIETHLFFSRIMKEHAMFLEAGFPCREKDCIEEAEHYRRKFEELLQDTIKLSDGNIHEAVLNSDELITEFTIPAERRTEALSGIPIDIKTSEQIRALHCGCNNIRDENRHLYQQVMQLNEHALGLLNGLIHFKENILRSVNNCRLFTANYPLLIEHITREARLYRDIIGQLLANKDLSYESLYETESFWNQIMMEHAWFIRGLLDPSEAQLIDTADEFSKDYSRLLDMSYKQDCHANSMTEKTLGKTLEYRDFKAAGAQGILDCQISSIILPLLADHVLREANHYIRILETGRTR